MIKTKKSLKLNLKTQSMRVLSNLQPVAGGMPPETRNLECFSRDCTHDLFCPTAAGRC